MNTLRILSLVCGASRIKQRIGLLTLLLLWPAFASAACLPSQTCLVTSGTMVATSSDGSVPFNFAGNGFSASGVLAGYGNLSFPIFDSQEAGPFEAGSALDIGMGGTPPPDGTLVQFALTVNGVPWGIPETGGGDTFVFFNASAVIPEFFNTECCTAPAVFDGSFTGAPEPFLPGLGCDVLNCETLNFH